MVSRHICCPRQNQQRRLRAFCGLEGSDVGFAVRCVNWVRRLGSKRRGREKKDLRTCESFAAGVGANAPAQAPPGQPTQPVWLWVGEAPSHLGREPHPRVRLPRTVRSELASERLLRQGGWTYHSFFWTSFSRPLPDDSPRGTSRGSMSCCGSLDDPHDRTVGFDWLASKATHFQLLLVRSGGGGGRLEARRASGDGGSGRAAKLCEALLVNKSFCRRVGALLCGSGGRKKSSEGRREPSTYTLSHDRVILGGPSDLGLPEWSPWW
jgi:hypothetical protein